MSARRNLRSIFTLGTYADFLERGLLMNKSVWGREFALLILHASHFSQISHENEIIWSHSLRPNYFIFMGYLKTGGVDGRFERTP